MKYKFFEIYLNSGNKDHIVLNYEQAAALGLAAGDRVELINDRSKETLKNVIVDLNQHRQKKSIGVFSNTIDRLKLKKDDTLSIESMGKPMSTLFIKQKLDGKKLSNDQIDEIIKDVVEGNLSPVELAYFVAGGLSLIHI